MNNQIDWAKCKTMIRGFNILCYTTCEAFRINRANEKSPRIISF